jgi:hypothetical protein
MSLSGSRASELGKVQTSKKVGTGIPERAGACPHPAGFILLLRPPTAVEIATSPSLTWKGLSLLVTRDLSHVMGASACHDGTTERRQLGTALPHWYTTLARLS